MSKNKKQNPIADLAKANKALQKQGWMPGLRGQHGDKVQALTRNGQIHVVVWAGCSKSGCWQLVTPTHSIDAIYYREIPEDER